MNACGGTSSPTSILAPVFIVLVVVTDVGRWFSAQFEHEFDYEHDKNNRFAVTALTTSDEESSSRIMEHVAGGIILKGPKGPNGQQCRDECVTAFFIFSLKAEHQPRVSGLEYTL